MLPGTTLSEDVRRSLYSLGSQAPFEIRTLEGQVLHDGVQERDVCMRMHYPAGAGPFPVIVFSHGSFCGYTQYDRLTRHWAARGYVVIMPQHPDALEAESAGGPPDLQWLLACRIRDMSFALDALPELMSRAGVPNLFRQDNAIAAGHSFGALTAMLKLGLGLTPGAYTLEDTAADPRFQAGLNMSGVGPLPPLAEGAFTHLSAPVLVTGGTLDEGNVGAGPVFPWDWRMSAYALAPAGDKYSLVLDQADHYLGGLLARDDRGGDADESGVALLAAVSTAFLDAYAKQDPAASDWLHTVALKHLTGGRAELTYK